MKYTITTYSITKPGAIDTKGANAVLIVNRGEALAIVNNEEIATDQFISNSGLRGEIDTTLYDVKFNNSGGQSQKVFVRIKKYVNS